MRSSDLARLAGVSVRTLRHYHEIELLPEPERSPNGYRMYTALDLVRVLKVRRLASLGVPLSRIDPTGDAEEELALLDRQYERQIEDLQERLAIVRGLRQPGIRADTPGYAYEYLTALGGRQSVSRQSLEAERDAAIVLDLFLDKDSLAGLEVLNGPQISQLADVATALLGLRDDTPDARIEAVADALAVVVGRLQHSIATLQLTQEVERSLEHHVSEQLTAVQLDAVHRALRRLPR